MARVLFRASTSNAPKPVALVATLATAVLLALAMLLCAGCGKAAKYVDSNDIEFQKAFVVRVSDGDTIVVRLQEGSTGTHAGSEGSAHGSPVVIAGTKDQYKLRLIGINTPESVAEESDRNCPEGKEASAHLKSLLPSGTTVWLQKDVSDADRYGRMLRYVWLEKPTDANDRDEISTKMVNAMLVIDGWAEAKEYRPDTTYHELFEEFERTATRNGSPYSSGRTAAEAAA